MAINSITQRAVAEFTAQTATTVVTVGTDFTAGTFAQLMASANANKVFSSIADSRGNTWTVDITASDGARTISHASSSMSVGRLITGDTITITWSNATSGQPNVWLHEIAADGALTFDQSASGTGTGTALATSASGTLAGSSEIVLACFRTTGAGAGWTKGASYSNLTTPQTSTNLGTGVEYKIVASNAAVTADGTWSASGTWIGLLAAYNEGSAAPAPRNVAGWITRSGGR